MLTPLNLHEAFAEAGEPETLQQLSPATHEAYRLICNSYPHGLTIIRVECGANPEMETLAGDVAPKKLNEAEVAVEEIGAILPRFSYQLIRHDWEWNQERRSAQRKLTQINWVSLRILIRESRFWELAMNGGSVGVDGCTFTLEGTQKKQYRKVSRWCPNANRDREWFVLPCHYLQELADKRKLLS